MKKTFLAFALATALSGLALAQTTPPSNPDQSGTTKTKKQTKKKSKKQKQDQEQKSGGSQSR